MNNLFEKLFGTMDEPTTLTCVLFYGTIIGAMMFCIAGIITGCLA